MRTATATYRVRAGLVADDGASRGASVLVSLRRNDPAPASAGDLPARRESWSDPKLAGDRNANAFRTQLERVVATPKVPEWEQIATRGAECAALVWHLRGWANNRAVPHT